MDIYLLYEKFRRLKKVSTDTRKDVKHSIFFALSGENFDGNEYAKPALDQGANFVVVDKPIGIDDDRVILVESSLKCLQRLARLHRDQFDFPVLGITGSNGKTTTKELIAAVLSEEKKIAFTQGNFNNHIGVPLTLLSITEPVDLAIIEMGANHIGEIYELCGISNPNYGLITNIGQAHLEGFETFENVILTKNGLYRWVIENHGTLFYNEEDHLLRNLIDNYSERIAYRPSGLEIIETFPGLKLQMDSREISTRLIGNYNRANVAAAMSIAKYFGVRLNSIIRGLENYNPSNNRSQLMEVNGITFVLDSYNANPDSMKSSIESFIDLNAKMDKFIILGDMFELGDFAQDAHNELVSKANELKYVEFVFVGDNFYNAQRSMSQRSQFFKNLEDFFADFDFRKLQNKIVLLKGSRGIGLEKIIRKLN